MPLPPRRTFTGLDAVLMFAATVVGLAGFCAVFAQNNPLNYVEESIRAVSSADDWRLRNGTVPHLRLSGVSASTILPHRGL